jgi:tRNA nucleotidyltransferase (CCA-adding enzyme)
VEWNLLKQKILKKIEPTQTEEKIVTRFTNSLLQKINIILEEAGIEGKAEIHGSVAHGTWISGKQDFDIFIVLEEKNKKLLNEVLNLIQKEIDGKFIEAYAEHPYLQSEIAGFTVDFVPCFKINLGEDIISATDRTPLHSKYLEYNLDDEKRREIRLLKQFTKGIDVYGAEIKIGGFSGYLCELLILKYSSLWALLESSKNWLEGIRLSLTEDEILEFNDPLVFTDPVDPSRNVASALSKKSFWTFIYAVEWFIQNPNEIFFFPKPEEVTHSKMTRLIEDRATDLVFLIVDEDKVDVPDVLYGILYKSRKSIEKALEKGSFEVLKSSVWSDEICRHIFIFELQEANISGVEKHYGPPGRFRKGSKDFIEKYLGSECIVSGPVLEGDKWFVLKKREYVNVLDFLDHKLKDGGVSIGVSRPLSLRIIEQYKLLLNMEIQQYLRDDFTLHLLEFLKGRPVWLE